LQDDQREAKARRHDQRTHKNGMALDRVATPKRLRGEARRPHAQKAETPEGEVKDDGRRRDGTQKVSLAQTADHRRVDEAQKRRRKMREHHWQRKTHNRHMGDDGTTLLGF